MQRIQRLRMRLRPGQPLLHGPARHWALLLTGCCAVITVVLGLIVARRPPLGIDVAIDTPVISALGSHQWALLHIVWFGSLVPVTAISAMIVVGCLLAGRLNGAILGAFAAPIADGLDEFVLKPVFHRADLGFLSYPSGHTTAVLALGGTMTVLLALPAEGSRRSAMRRALIPVVAGLIACVMAVALIALGWHYFTDVIGGAAVAIGTVCALALLLDLPVTRRLLTRVTGGAEERFPADASPAEVPSERLADPRFG